jgi:formylglycine-generating enzyme required for sulfatase activity
VPLSPLAFVPAGEFLMGSKPGTDPFGDKFERPAHTVKLSAFWIETMEVSNAHYALCVADGACLPPQSGASRTHPDYYLGYADYPVVNVTHAQAQEFCAWAGGRLPTEAEWEYAARFNDGRIYPWGNATPDFALANYGHEEGDTEPVYFHQEGATALGLRNMAGNVWEWVADWYSDEYYANSPEKDPPGPAEGTERIARGGAFATDAVFIRTTNRYARDPNRGYTNVGFRCVTRNPPPGAQRLPTLTPSPTP